MEQQLDASLSLSLLLALSLLKQQRTTHKTMERVRLPSVGAAGMAKGGTTGLEQFLP